MSRVSNASLILLIVLLDSCLSFPPKNKSDELVDCVIKNDFEKLKDLVNKGYPLNERDSYTGRTALHFAANRGNYAMVEFLLKSGADVTIQGNSGKTPLMSAFYKARRDNDEVIALLLAHGADKTINIPDSDGHTPLMWASKSFSPRVVKLLIDHGADVNYGDHRSWLFFHVDPRPLSWAIMYNKDGSRDEVIAILKAAGAHE